MAGLMDLCCGLTVGLLASRPGFLTTVTRSFCVVWGLAARGASRKVTAGIVVVGIIFFIQSLVPGALNIQ